MSSVRHSPNGRRNSALSRWFRSSYLRINQFWPLGMTSNIPRDDPAVRTRQESHPLGRSETFTSPRLKGICRAMHPWLTPYCHHFKVSAGQDEDATGARFPGAASGPFRPVRVDQQRDDHLECSRADVGRRHAEPGQPSSPPIGSTGPPASSSSFTASRRRPRAGSGSLLARTTRKSPATRWAATSMRACHPPVPITWSWWALSPPPSIIPSRSRT